MPAEQFSGPEQQNAPKRQGAAEPLSAEALAQMAQQRRAEQSALAQAEAARQQQEWPPKVQDELLAQLDEMDSPARVDESQADDDLLGDMLDGLDAPRDAAPDDLDGLFDDLGDESETVAITPEARVAALEAWIVEELPDCRPADVAAGLCFDYEQSVLSADPEYDVMADDGIAEELKRKLGISTNTAKADAMETVLAEPETMEAQTQETQIVGDAREDEAATQIDLAETQSETAITETETSERIDSLSDLIAPYNEMLPRLGQVETLRTLMTQTDSPEIKGRLAAIIATLDRVRQVVPTTAQSEITRIFDSVSLNLAGASVLDSFMPVLAAVDRSETLPAEAKAAIREAIYGEHYDRTGGDVRESATATTTNENGETVPVYTADNPKPVRPGVSAYSETGDEVLVRLDLPGHPPVTREVTGWSNDDIGLLAEAMGFAAGLEQYGVTGFVEDIYKMDFNVLGDSAFDRDSLRDIRQMISAMVGSFEGYDGDIFDVREKIGLIRHQARLLSDEDTAYGTENSREDTMRSARKLGLRNEDGELNFAVLKEFGRFAQETYLSEDATHADAQARLYGLFPEFVEVPMVAEQPMPLDKAA